jgi:spermidine synthase
MPLLAISAISAGVLAYEILLMRLFAIVQWHHFAYMVISIALLGYGVSGTFLSLTQNYMKRHFTCSFAVSAGLFGLSAPASFILAQRVPFNALEVVWDPKQFLYLLVLYGLFTVPFLCGANCVGLAFARFGDRIGRIYRYDLVGAGLGAIGMVAALFLLFPADCLRIVSGLGIAAAGLACLAGGSTQWRLRAAVLLATAVVLPLALPKTSLALRLSEYKGLSMALQVPGTEVISEHSSPLGLLTVVRSDMIPFRHAPGLSLNSAGVPPDQLGVFTDGDALSVINRFEGGRAPLAHLDFMTSALPYHLTKRPSVLVLGAGGGTDVLQALYHEPARIDAVELNPQMADLVRRTHHDFAGGLYDLWKVQLHVAEARGFVAGSRIQWDVIQIPLLDSFATSAAGVHSLSESYIYTIEAFGAYIQHLTPQGILAITRWIKLPPRDSLKLLATAFAALARNGVAEPHSHLALIRSWNTTTLLLKRTPFTAHDLKKIRGFSTERWFDIAYVPGMAPGEANRFNILDQPYFFHGARALLGHQSGDFIAQYKFDLTPTTDDRPYFFDFFKWRSLPEFVELRARGGTGLLEWGYLILFATLVQALLLSVGLILLPLWVWRREPARSADSGRTLTYFLGLGLAFLFVEIAFIQRFIVFLSHPLYAIAVVLCGFLLFAGLGSGYAPRFADRLRNRARASPLLAKVSAIDVAIIIISAVSLAYLALLPILFERLMGWPEIAKVILSLLLIAPLAFFMGMPFPLGLSRVSQRIPELVPWAWGVNGCASVISAILATILAIHFGFTIVVVLAVFIYVAAALTFRPLDI